jgi:hypothetical protein
LAQESAGSAPRGGIEVGLRDQAPAEQPRHGGASS